MRERVNLNYALQQRKVAEARLRIHSQVEQLLNHELSLKLAKTPVDEQMKVLFNLEAALKKITL